MTITTLTSRDFNQHASEAKKAANRGPVFITDRGRPAHVLLSIQDYLRITANSVTISAMLAMHGDADFEFEAPPLTGLPVPADFS